MLGVVERDAEFAEVEVVEVGLGKALEMEEVTPNGIS